uniref:Uncharacterized protein n=2 Tax=Parascaris univalens TaxID=6257 RepID=A0A915BE89_PARUN
ASAFGETQIASTVVSIIIQKMSWQRESIDTFLIIFTLVVALIALLLVIFVFFKGKLCPRRSIYASQSIIANDTAANLSPSKVPLRSDEGHCVDLPELDYIDERSTHLISSTVIVNSLHNSPIPVVL